MAIRSRVITREEAEDRERVIKMIRDHMEARGYNMLTLSKAIGKNDAYIQQFFEKGVPRALSEDVRHALSKALNLHEMHFRIGRQQALPDTGRGVRGEEVYIKAPSEIAGAAPSPVMKPIPQVTSRLPDDKSGSQPLEPIDVPRVSTMAKDVPVLGTAVGGSDADFEMNGQIIDYVRRPPGIEHARDVFAIYVVGSSMEPRFEEGEMVYVNPKRVPRIGDYVLVELHGKDAGDVGRCLIKKLVKRSPVGLVLEQFNPPRDDIQCRAEEVKAVHRIMPWTEVLGI